MYGAHGFQRLIVGGGGGGTVHASWYYLYYNSNSGFVREILITLLYNS